jgi:hypothetical protein
MSAITKPVNGTVPPQQWKGLTHWSKVLSTDMKNTFLKPIYHGIGWMKLVRPDLASAYQWISPLDKHSKMMKNGMGMAEVLPNLCKFGNSIRSLLSVRSGTALLYTATQVVVDGAGVVSPVCDTVDAGVSSGVLSLSSQFMRTVAKSNTVALFIASTNGIVTEVKNMTAAKAVALKMSMSGNQAIMQQENQKISLATMNLAKWVSYFALSSYFLFIAGAVVPPWIPLAYSTSALFFTNAGTVYKNVHDHLLKK